MPATSQHPTRANRFGVRVPCCTNRLNNALNCVVTLPERPNKPEARGTLTNKAEKWTASVPLDGHTFNIELTCDPVKKKFKILVDETQNPQLIYSVTAFRSGRCSPFRVDVTLNTDDQWDIGQIKLVIT